jgi:serine protease AprX
MSTPLVAGCVAVVREVLEKYGIKQPSAALVKAIIINGAVPLPGISINAQGFGRVNLQNSVAMIATEINEGAQLQLTGIRIGQPLKQDQEAEYLINVAQFPVNKAEVQGPNAMAVGIDHSSELASEKSLISKGGSPRFKITLVYTDRPGAVLPDNPNLIVRAADGSERHGNYQILPNNPNPAVKAADGSGRDSYGYDENDEYDNFNNVEQILWESMPLGEAKVIVRARNITQKDDEQGFALAWSTTHVSR